MVYQDKGSKMQMNTTGYLNANKNALQNSTLYNNSEKLSQKQPQQKEELTAQEHIEKSAVEVSLSMNAQIVLFSMNSGDKIKDNTSAQKDILSFLSGESISEDFNLKNTGYEGKPITELSVEEATELIDDDGFFGIEKTSQRVANFVFNFSGDDIELLEKGREGIVTGYNEAQEMWSGELPQISVDTQAKTLELIDARIAELKDQNK